MGVMTETQTSIISPNASPPANPIHANQTPGSHGGADSRCRTDHEVENSAITPIQACDTWKFGKDVLLLITHNLCRTSFPVIIRLLIVYALSKII